MYPFRHLFEGILEYSLRAALAVKADDILFLRREMPGFLADLEHHGLSAYKTYFLPSEGCMATAALNSGPCIDFLRQEASRSTVVLQPFITTKPVLALVDAVPGMTLAASRFNLVEKVNDKASMREIFARFARMPRGGCCGSELEIRNAAKDLRKQGVKLLVLKDPSPYIASGKSKIAEMRADGPDSQFELHLQSLLATYRNYRGKKVVILEEWFENVVDTPSTTMNITADGRIEPIAYTRQLMDRHDKSEYRGSTIPHNLDGNVLIRMAEVTNGIADWHVKQGYVGVLCIDFIIVKDANGSLLVIPTEVNGRYSASMYLANVMRRLQMDSWFGFSSNLSVSKGTDYETFRAAIELVSGRPGERIIPFNVGTFHVGKASVIICIDWARFPKDTAYRLCELRAEEICREIESLCSASTSYFRPLQVA